MRELLKFIHNFDIAKEVRDLIESNHPIIISGPERQDKLDFFKVCCLYRRPLDSVALLSKDKDLVSYFKEHIPEAISVLISEKLNVENALSAVMRKDPSGYWITEGFSSREEFSTFFYMFLRALQYEDTLNLVSNQKDSHSTVNKWKEQVLDSSYADFFTTPELAKLMIIKPIEEALNDLIKASIFINIEERKISSIEKWVYENKELKKTTLFERVVIPVLKERDRFLEMNNVMYEIPQPLTIKKEFLPQKVKAKGLMTEKILSKRQQELSTSTDESKLTAYAPLCRDLALKEQAILNEWIFHHEKKIHNTREPHHLMMQIESDFLPDQYRKFLGSNKILRLLFNVDNKRSLKREDYKNPFGKSFKVKVLEKKEILKNYPANLPINIFRERYAIEKLFPIDDFYSPKVDRKSNLSFHGNKFGGHPQWWLYEPEKIKCPECQKPMELFFQLNLENGEFKSYCSGFERAYVFFCQDHPEEWGFLRQ